MKFEQRWTMNKLNTRVRNWVWDTVLNAHIIDSRPNITSVKFQSFALLGLESYDSHIKPFLKSKKGLKVNQILEEIDLQSLLLYNGLDSLTEWHLAMAQAEILGIEL